MDIAFEEYIERYQNKNPEKPKYVFIPFKLGQGTMFIIVGELMEKSNIRYKYMYGVNIIDHRYATYKVDCVKVVDIINQFNAYETYDIISDNSNKFIVGDVKQFNYGMSECYIDINPAFYNSIDFMQSNKNSNRKKEFFDWIEQLNGTVTQYDCNGGPIYQAQYINGEKHGKVIDWYSHTVNKSDRPKIMRITTYNHDIAHGDYVRYSSNGEIKDKSYYTNGKLIVGRECRLIGRW